MSRPQRIVKRPLRFDDDVDDAIAQVGRCGNPPSKRRNRDGVRDGGTSATGRVGADRSRNGGADLPGDNGIQARTFAHPPVHVHARTRTRTCACTRTRTRTRTRACARACTRTCTHTHSHAHICARTRTHRRTNMHVHTHTHTRTHAFEVRA